MPGTAGFENNLQAWNLKANLLFFESPAGVGFSPITDPTYEYTDVNTGADNYAALVLWF
jgi:carboxypeptidase C (cathepsin A)